MVIETMTAVDDFESFANFMDTAVAGGEDGDDGRDEEEGKRPFSSKCSERGSQSSDNDAKTRRK